MRPFLKIPKLRRAVSRKFDTRERSGGSMLGRCISPGSGNSALKPVPDLRNRTYCSVNGVTHS